MPNLYSLKVKCKNDLSPIKSDNDELIQWLTYHLSSTYLIVRHPKENNYILVWR